MLRPRSRSVVLEPLALALAAALTVGTGLGLASGWPYLEAGFPWLAVASVRTGVDRFLVGALAFLALFLLLLTVLRRRMRPTPAVLLATAVTATPFGLAWAYLFNLYRAFIPSDLLHSYGLLPNLRLLLVFCLCVAATAGLLTVWTGKRLASETRPPIAVLVTLALLAVALNALPAVAVAMLPAPSGARPNVIVILVDALRRDELGCYGYSRPTSPAIDAFARDAVVFDQAISQSTFTKSSISSLFTGRYPYQHGVYWGNRTDTANRLTSDVLADRETTLAEALRTRGYLTAAWVQNSHLRPYMGFAQGFVSYLDQQGDARHITDRFLDWIRGPARRHPFFTYLHYIDLHDPYQPPAPYDRLFGDGGNAYQGIDLDDWGAYLAGVREGKIQVSPERVARFRALYDGEVREVDDQVSRLFADLRKRGLYDRSMIVLTADHGDGFMEHGFISHSTTPYEELVRVPLIVKLPGQKWAGRRVARQVRLIDLFPTVLDLVGVRPPRDISGCSLRPLFSSPPGAWPPNPSCSYAVTEIAEKEGEKPTMAIRGGGFKYIRKAHGEELYDLRTDPGERTNLLGRADPDRLAVFRRMADRIEAIRAKSKAGSVVLDEQTIRQLKALGYID